ncbi:hypothetical protein Taro_043995 [Colocasia esculenta]|uniref:GDSL esterase/lipase n=1 Tax=Colocasia esculenta TaxID=4460 RepID=A0A843WZX8_COLES|nr:hypothetical protein [Colocasia esculenta]
MARLGVWMAVMVLTMAAATVAWSGDPQVPCFFIFGDSLVDNGNNNNLLTLARANYAPYGIDFPQGASGRFNNGRTVVDILAQLLGFRGYIPPREGTRGTAILRGLNFASGAAGIRDETGNNLGDHFSMVEQVEHFRTTAQQMARMFRGNRTALFGYLNRCIFAVGMGSNDYLNNYFMPSMYSTSYDYNPKTYAALLIQDYERQLTALYDLGARKVAIVGVGQIGCIPYELARYNSRANGSRCNERINKAIDLYNAGLLRLVESFNNELPDAKFVFVNTYESSKDLTNNAAAYGFEVIDKGCCGVGRNNGQITCLPFQQPCEDRSKYLFWDAFHPTEAANLVYARKAYASTSTADVYPMNIQQLAMA